jgi:hypothetical protein
MKEMIIDGESEALKLHALSSQVGTTERIILPPWKPLFCQVNSRRTPPQHSRNYIPETCMCLPINDLNNTIYLIKDTSIPLSNQLLPKKTKK